MSRRLVAAHTYSYSNCQVTAASLSKKYIKRNFCQFFLNWPQTKCFFCPFVIPLCQPFLTDRVCASATKNSETLPNSNQLQFVHTTATNNYYIRKRLNIVWFFHKLMILTFIWYTLCQNCLFFKVYLNFVKKKFNSTVLKTSRTELTGGD